MWHWPAITPMSSLALELIKNMFSSPAAFMVLEISPQGLKSTECDHESETCVSSACLCLATLSPEGPSTCLGLPGASERCRGSVILTMLQTCPSITALPSVAFEEINLLEPQFPSVIMTSLIVTPND